jgi:ABC-type lipoprotein release transport system permease subunit
VKRVVPAAFWVKVAAAFLLRSGRSSAVLSAMVVTAVAALVFLSALAVGVNDAMLDNSVGLFAGYISADNLPPAFDPVDLATAEVKGVLKRFYLPGTLVHGGKSQSLVLCSVDPAEEMKLTALPRKIVAGRYLRGRKAEVLVSSSLAAELAVEPGARLQFLSEGMPRPLSLKVAGVYHTGIDGLDRRLAFCPLDAPTVPSHPWSAAIFLREGASVEKVLDQLARRLGDSVALESWKTTMPDLRQLIELQYVSMAIVILLVFAVVAIGIAGSFVLFIIRNMREYGVMRSMGVTTGQLGFLLLTKVALMNLLACLAGLFGGILAVWVVNRSGGIDISAFTSHNPYFVVSGVIRPRATLFSLCAPPGTALLFGLAAALWPAILVARKKAADILRMV